MATPGDYIKIELKEAKPTSVVFTGTRADSAFSATATLTLTPTGGTAITETITMAAGEGEKDYVISGLTPETTYIITGTGQYDSGGSVSSVTTIEDSPKTATISQWEDLAERVKNAGGLPTTTTFWGQIANGGVVSGDISVGGKVTNLSTPTTGTDAANKDYVDANGKVEKAGQTAWTSATLRYFEETGSDSKGALFPAGLDMSDEPFYVGIGASGTDTPADGYGPRPYLLKGHVSSSGAKGVVGKTRISLFAEMEDRILEGGTTAPTTSTVGKVGTLYAYVENGTGHLAICADVTGGTYTWQTLI